MAQTKIKAGLFEGIIGNGTDGYFLMSNGDGTMTWASTIPNPTITSIAYPDSATAADPAGGETITVTGTGFKTGVTLTVGGTTAPAVSYVSATEITFTTPAKAAGDYDIVVTNTDTGSATYINGISYNGIPSWTTPTGSLGTFASGETISTITLQATEPDAGTITFNITSGALPTGLSLTGADIDGTTSLETADTLYTFTVTATDDESQATPRTFTITVEKQFINTDNFGIVTYSGSNQESSRSISSLDFQPDFIIHKARNDGWPNFAYDSVRGAGATKELQINSNAAEGGYNNEAYGYLSSFDSNGFTSAVGSAFPYDNQYFNKSGINFVAWCFKAGGTAVSNTDGGITTNVSANPAAGFSIVEYQGAGGGGSTGTGLSSPVELMIVKRYTTTQEFYLFQGSGTGTWNSFQMNSNTTSSGRSVTVTNSTIQIPAAGDFNSDSNSRYIAYCFHSVAGYQKIGTYTGNGSTTGPTITTGFRPRFLMVKGVGNTGFRVVDTTRSPSNPVTKDLRFESGTVENDWPSNGWGNIMNINSTGFEIISNDSQYNTNTQTYIYWAIA